MISHPRINLWRTFHTPVIGTQDKIESAVQACPSCRNELFILKKGQMMSLKEFHLYFQIWRTYNERRL